MLTPFVKPRQVLPVESLQQSCAIESRQQFLDAAIATKFFLVKLAQNCRKTILSAKVRVHLSLHHQNSVAKDTVIQNLNRFE